MSLLRVRKGDRKSPWGWDQVGPELTYDDRVEQAAFLPDQSDLDNLIAQSGLDEARFCAIVPLMHCIDPEFEEQDHWLYDAQLLNALTGAGLN